jgi:hypothetical protein
MITMKRFKIGKISTDPVYSDPGQRPAKGIPPSAMKESMIIPFCCFLFLAAAALGAKTYSGFVVDKETEARVAGVSVALSYSTEKATTDENGYFSLSSQIVVKGNCFHSRGSDVVHWNNRAHSFDLSSAPLITSISLYDLKGKRLFFRKRPAGAATIDGTGLPASIYVVRLATSDNTHTFIRWAQTGGNASFLIGNGKKVNPLSKRRDIDSALVFEKQGYQTKQVGIFSDSTYTSMVVKMKPAIGDHVFAEDTVRTYHLTLTADAMARLLDYSKLVPEAYTVNSEIVPARLTFEGRALDSVGIRFRGDQSLWDCVADGKKKTGLSYPQFGFGNGDGCAKFSMKFDFNRYKEEQRLYGLKALNFRSMSFDPTKMHEKLAFSLFHDMGIAAPRVAYAKLFVNDSLWGLFCVVEEIDGRFTKSRYPESGDGNLYKEIWPEAPVTDYNMKKALATNNDAEDTIDISDFRALRDAVKASTTDSAAFTEKMKPLVDIPHLVRYLAVDRGIMNFDGIMAAYAWNGGHTRHNYFWYHDDETGLFRLIPWDMDKVFIYPEPNFWTNNQPNGRNMVPNWNVVNTSYSNIQCTFDPGSASDGYMVEPIDKDPFLRLLRNATWNDFGRQSRVFLDSFFVETKITERLGKWRTLLAGAVGEDPTIDSAEWSIMVDSLSHTIPLMRKNLEMMIDTLIVK